MDPAPKVSDSPTQIEPTSCQRFSSDASTAQITMSLREALHLPRRPTRTLPVLTDGNWRQLFQDYMAARGLSVTIPLTPSIDFWKDNLASAYDWYRSLAKARAAELGHLSSFVDVLTAKDRRPLSTIDTTAPYEAGKVYVAFGRSGQELGDRPYFLVCHEQEVYAGKTADTYQASLHLLRDGATLPDWVVPSGRVTERPAEGTICLMDKSLAHYLVCEHFRTDRDYSVVTQRVFVKLPRTDPPKSDATPNNSDEDKAKQYDEVLKRFARERGAEARLSGPLLDRPSGDCEDALIDDMPQLQVVPRRLFHVRLASLAVADSKPAALRRIFDQGYPVWQDHGPSLRMVTAALNSMASWDSDVIDWTVHPHLRAVVELLTGDDGQNIVGKCYSQAMDRLAHMHRLEAFHSAIASRNICVQVQAKGKDGAEDKPCGDRASSGRKPSLHIQIIDFASMTTKESLSRYWKDGDMCEEKLRERQVIDITGLQYVVYKLNKAVIKARKHVPSFRGFCDDGLRDSMSQ